MSISLIVTRGFGNGTLIGAIKDTVTRGYSIGDVVITADILGVLSFVSNTPMNLAQSNTVIYKSTSNTKEYSFET